MQKKLMAKIFSSLMIVSFITVNGGIQTSVQAAVVKEANSSYSWEVNGIEWDYDVDGEGNAINVGPKDTSEMRGNGTITSVIIPEELEGKAVTSIKEKAFDNCDNLTSITIPKGVTSIGIRAFDDCDNLTNIMIPEAVTSIGERAFFGCSRVTDIIVSEENPKYKSVDGILYNKDKTQIIYYPQGKSDKYYDILDGVTYISNYAFYGCEKLIGINIPETVINIGFEAFGGCENIANITIPKGVTTISSYLFADCRNLKTIDIPEKVTSIGNGAFLSCGMLESIIIPQGVTSIGEGAFCGCSRLANIIIPEGVTILNGGTFYKCSNLKSVVIPEGVKKIGYYDFLGCSSLISICIPDSVKDIADNSFESFMESATIYANSGSYASTFDWGSVKVDTETGYIKGKSINTEIKQVELGISSFKANVATPQNVGTAITLSLTSIGGIGTIQSKYVVFDGVKWIVIKNYSTQPNVTWRPSKAGTYTLYACVKDNTGKIEKKSMTYVIKSPLKVTSFTSNLASPQKIGQGIKLSSTSSGGTGTIQIKYVVFDGLKWSIIKNYSTQVNATWKPSNVGNYTLYACVMDGTGEIIKKTINYVIK